MRRGRIFIYLAFIIILGLVAFALIYQRFLSPSGTQGVTEAPQPTQVVETVNVLVVTQRVSRGTAVDSTVLGTIPIQRELFIDGMFTSINEVEGSLAKFDLEAGIPLTRGMLVDSAEELSATGSVAALSIPRGMVAVSIPISRLSSVSYAPRPGDHVNVIVSVLFVDLDTDFQTLLPNRNTGVFTPGSGEGSVSGATGGTTGEGEATSGSGSSSLSFTSENVVAVSASGVVGKTFTDPVLGQTFYYVPSEARQRPRLASQNLLQDVVTPEAGPDVITLIVTPQDAISLNYLIYSGAELTLALRSAEDDSRVETEAVTLQYLMEQYNISVPARLPNGMEPPVTSLDPPTLERDINPEEGQ
jgi:Flp pilus assembly protein CpaB